MRLGIISDIHGNTTAFEAVWDELQSQKVDRIICLGDVVDPLPGSGPILRFLKDQHVPTLRGNHEDYVLMATENPIHPWIGEPRFAPVHRVAQDMSAADLETLRQMPMTLTFDDPSLPSILFCHASPESNLKGWRSGVETEIGTQLESVEISFLVGGHWHRPGIQQWKDKTLVTVGSLGLPLNEKQGAEFLVLESRGRELKVDFRVLPYDVEKAVDQYWKSGWVHAGAPMSILFLLELATGRRALSPIFDWAQGKGLSPFSLTEWKQATELYLKETGRWSILLEIQPLAAELLRT